MKLAAKLISGVVLFIVLVLAVDGYLSLQREEQFLRSELQRKAYRIGDAMRELVADVWRTNGSRRALELIETANQEQHLLFIRWVWLDAEPDDQRYRPRVPQEKLVPVVEGRGFTIEHTDEQGHRQLYTYIRVSVDDPRRGAIELAEPLNVVDDFVRTSVYHKVALAGIIVVAATLLAVAMGMWLVGLPLKRLADKALRVGDGDLQGPVQVRGRDELADLAEALNAMCDQLAESRDRLRAETEARIATLEQLRHADRLRTVGQLASGVAHEMGTPLNVVSGRAGLIGSGRLAQDDVAESAAIIKAQADRMTQLIRQLLDFSRRSASKRAMSDVRQIAEQTRAVLESLSKKRSVTLRLDAGDPAMAYVDAGQIQQVLTNLIVNGIHAVAEGGEVTVALDRKQAIPPDGHDSAAGEFLRVSVRDNGRGIPDEHRQRLFEPFFTTKDVGEGTGLGLSIAYGIVQEHGGWIDVSSEPGQGSCFAVYLPLEVNECPDEF